MLHVASVCTPCCMLLRVVAQSFKPVKSFSQYLPPLFFLDHRSVAQQFWIRLHSSSNIFWGHGLDPSHAALQVQTLLGVVASVCTPLPTRTQQLPALLAYQCWELLRSFARSLPRWKRIFLYIIIYSARYHTWLWVLSNKIFNLFYWPLFR